MKPIILTCAGGCGATQTVRPSKIKTGRVFICNRKATREVCAATLPRTAAGCVRTLTPKAAGAFTAVDYVLADPFTRLAASLAGVRDVLLCHLAGRPLRLPRPDPALLPRPDTVTDVTEQPDFKR